MDSTQPAPEMPAPRPEQRPSATGDSDRRIGLAVSRRPVHIAFTGVLTVMGAVVGKIAADWYVGYLREKLLIDSSEEPLSLVCITLIGMLMGFLMASITFRQIAEVVPKIEQLPVEDKVVGLTGVVLGLIVAYLFSPLVKDVKGFGGVLVALSYLSAIPIAILFTFSMKKELMAMLGSGGSEAEASPAKGSARSVPKLLDTNVIIDGRILDIWNSGFIEGELLLPQFVLDELQMIADSADELKRARGRRGLDLLNRMKDEIPTFRVLRPREYVVSLTDAEGVDGKLIRLASYMDAAVVTNDFNLNRVADVQGVPVLNVNRLVLALKPVVLAGEELTVNIIRPGRDPGQGVAYLDDGTMLVVEDGESKVGRVVDVVVSSTLQTVAGKMIFAELKENGPRQSRVGHQR